MGTYLDVYQITDFQRLVGQTLLNVYFYQILDPSVTDLGAQEVVTAFVEQVLPDILLTQVDAVLHTTVRAVNLFDESDTFTQAVSYSGGVASELQTTFTAYPFTLVQDNGAVKNGAKRIAGVYEQAATEGVVTDAGLLAVLNNLADTLILPLILGEAETWFPVVVKRILEAGEYRLPANLGEAVIGLVIDVLFNTLLTSQVSRKEGVGM